MWCLVFVVFFKQKTAYGMRISDWSADVCSSDLTAGAEETARCDGLVNIDNIARANAADRAIAIDRHIARPALAELQRLRQAIGGKAARTIFADVLLVRRREQPRPRPGREVETAPRGTRLHLRSEARRVGEE